MALADQSVESVVSGAMTNPTAHVAQDSDPSDVGLDQGRLDRMTEHFKTYVDDGRLPGWIMAVSRNGKVPYVAAHGHRDMESSAPVEADTVFRIFSMTKPITTVAAMMLYEEGKLDLTDPVAKYIPAFGDTRVYLRGPATNAATAPQEAPMTVHSLMTHTSGLTYGFSYANGIDHLYRQAGFEWGIPAGLDLEACCNIWAKIPLLFQPGTEWNYSVSTDVLGRVVEVASGMRLDDFIRTRITEPLRMHESSFWATDEQADRFASLYVPTPGTKKAMRMDGLGHRGTQPPLFLGGGGGMVATTGDYLRFTQFLLNRGELDGVRLLGPRTVDFMTMNHLPGGADLAQVGRPLFAESSFEGTGFGLGFAVVLDPAKTKGLSSKGEYNWGGAASTAFWVDPVEQITAVFMTQLLPSSTHPIRAEMRRFVNAAIVD